MASRHAGVKSRSVGIAVPFSHLWSESVDFDIRARQLAQGEEVAAELETRGVSVGRVVVFGDRDEAVKAADQLTGVDAIAVVQTMGVQPAFAISLLDQLSNTPLVIFAAVAHESLDSDFDHGSITADGALVGTPMLTSVLVRRARPYDLVVGSGRDSSALDSLALALRAAVAAAVLRRARIAVVGKPIDGYDCVTIDAERLARTLGTALIEIDPSEFRDRFKRVTAQEELRALQDVSSFAIIDADGESLRRSVRAIPAIASITADHRCDAGVMNCHVDTIRFSPEVGIAPCLGLGMATSLGVPWTCAGDALTAVAMLAVKAAGLPALYHELESVDFETGEFVVANSGEHDMTWGARGEVRLRPNGWFQSDPIPGCCLAFELPPGPASLVGFAQIDGSESFRFIVARGEVTQRTFASVGTVSAAFRFAGQSPIESWRRWCQSGVNHHSVLTTIEGADVVSAIGRHTGVGVIDACRPTGRDEA